MSAPTTDRVRAAQSLALLSHLARVAQREVDDEHADGTLRSRHYVVLTLLRDHGELTQRALADTLRLDPTNVVAVLNDLEAADLVARRRDPEDRRRHIVGLTRGGAKELTRAERRMSCVEDRVLQALSPEERATLHELLVRAVRGQLPVAGCAEGDA